MRAMILSLVRRFIKPLVLDAIDGAVDKVVSEVLETGKLSPDGVASVRSALDAAATEAKSRLNVL